MLTVDTLEPTDLADTARLHHDHLKLGLFPHMGRRFLSRYQQTFAESPYGIALVAHRDGRVVGAIFGTTSNPDHYRWVIRKHGWRLALAGGLSLLLRPTAAWHFCRTRLGRYVNGIRRHVGRIPPSFRQDAPLSVLTHIVTSEDERRRGIGRRLVARFRLLARMQGARHAVLITEEGGAGQNFFERIGCTCVAHRNGHDGETVCEYHLALGKAQLDTASEIVLRRRAALPEPHRERAGAGAGTGGLPTGSR